MCFLEVKRKKSKQCSRQKQKHSFHICVCFCWFFSEEGLTSCYKNIFIFVTIVELQDKSSVRNTAPAKARLQCHFNSMSPSSLCLFLSLSLSLAVAHQQAATNESKRACDTEGSVAGTFWVLCLNFQLKGNGDYGKSGDTVGWKVQTRHQSTK